MLVGITKKKKGQRRVVRLGNRHELTPTNDSGGSRLSSLRYFLYPLLMITYGICRTTAVKDTRSSNRGWGGCKTQIV